MNQSSFILGALLAGFVLFIAARGRLPTYAAVLWGPAPAPPGGSSQGGGGGIPGMSGSIIPGIGGSNNMFGIPGLGGPIPGVPLPDPSTILSIFGG